MDVYLAKNLILSSIGGVKMTTATHFDTLSPEIRARMNNIFQVSAQQRLAKSAVRTGKESIGETTCEICGGKSKLGFLIIHHIVPEHVKRQMGITDSRTARLCITCHSAVHDWYSKKVFSLPYDLETHSFRPRMATAMAREYQVAYEDFAKHKGNVQYSSRSTR